MISTLLVSLRLSSSQLCLLLIVIYQDTSLFTLPLRVKIVELFSMFLMICISLSALNLMLSFIKARSKFIEIIRPNSKNIIVGYIYRHPRMSVDDFNNNYIMPLLVEISSRNKEIFLLGDFNRDLLKSDSVKDCDHLDIFSSLNMLSDIILPTRVTETTNTIIDNIFFNSAECNPISGNIIHPDSDHLW